MIDPWSSFYYSLYNHIQVAKLSLFCRQLCCVVVVRSSVRSSFVIVPSCSVSWPLLPRRGIICVGGDATDLPMKATGSGWNWRGDVQYFLASTCSTCIQSARPGDGSVSSECRRRKMSCWVGRTINDACRFVVFLIGCMFFWLEYNRRE